MTLDEQIRAAMALYLSNGPGIKGATVTKWESAADAFGGCDTCGPDIDYRVDIWYVRDNDPHTRLWTYDGKFTEFIAAITPAGGE